MPTTIKNADTPARLKTLKADLARIITDEYQSIIRGELEAGNITRDESTKLQLWFVKKMEDDLDTPRTQEG